MVSGLLFVRLTSTITSFGLALIPSAEVCDVSFSCSQHYGCVADLHPRNLGVKFLGNLLLDEMMTPESGPKLFVVFQS